MNIALPTHARLYPTADDERFIDAHEIARRVQQACPNVVIDWRRGEEWVEASLQELIDRGTPEVILASHRRQFGRTAYISLTYPDWPNQPVYTIVSGIQRELGDSLFLEVTDPFHLDLLKRGAQEFAAALSFEYFLGTSHKSRVIRTVTTSGRNDPVAFVRWDMPAEHNPTLTLRELTDWKATTRQAVVRWLALCEYKDEIQKITAGFASHAAVADAVVNELEAIAPVERGWAIDIAAMPYKNAILLDHGDWMTILHLAGVLNRIVT